MSSETLVEFKDFGLSGVTFVKEKMRLKWADLRLQLTNLRYNWAKRRLKWAESRLEWV